MRILHVVDSLDRGGLERVVCDLSTEQLRRGQDVAVYCLHSPGSMASELQSLGVPVLCGHKRRGFDIRVIWQLRRYMAGYRAGIFHSHSMMPNYYAAAARVLSGLSVALVNTRHDMGSTRPGDLREKLYRLSVPFTQRVVMVSETVKQRFLSAGIVPPRKARVVMNGIHAECSQRSQPLARARARTLLQIEFDSVVAGCVGRLVELKNHASAIRAIAKVAHVFPAVRLLLIGGGPLKPALMELATQLKVVDRVTVFDERDDVRSLLPALDVFLMPSLTEGHSIALLEAAAAALPIVATDVGGNPEIVRHGETGLLVPAGDDDALAAAMCTLFADPTLASRLGAAARIWTTQNVSVQAMADAYAAIYAEALA